MKKFHSVFTYFSTSRPNFEMILNAIPRQGGSEEISINIDEKSSVADLRGFLAVSIFG